MKTTAVLVALLIVSGVPTQASQSQESPADQVAIDARIDSLRAELDGLDRRVGRVSSDLEGAADIGLVLFLFGAFCALWARNSGRSAWAWFFLGMFFNVVTVVVLLSKNARDQDAAESAGGG